MRYLFLQRPFLHRFDHEAFRRRINEHVRRWGIAYLLLIVAAALFQGHFSFGLNATPSLPHHLFLIHKGELPAARAVRRVPLAGRRPVSGGRHVREAPRRPAGRSCHARRSRLLRQRHPRRDRQDREPPGRPARARRDRGVTRRALLRAGPASGQPRLALSAHRMDFRRARSSDGRMRSSEHGARRVTRVPNWRPLLAAAAVLLSVTAHAQDLGVVGPVYPIAEVSLLEVDPLETARGGSERPPRRARTRRAGEGDPRDRGSRPRSTVLRRPRGRARSMSTRASSFPTRSPMPRARSSSRPGPG